MSQEIKIPDGFCECGCGARTTVLKNDDNVRGLKKGQSSRFVHGHYEDWVRRNKNPLFGSQYRRQKRREEARKILEIKAKDAKSIEELAEEFHGEFCINAISKMISTVRKSRMIMLGENFNERRPPVRFVFKVSEPYFRKEISYERSTELPLLTQKWGFVSLDEELIGRHEDRHSIVSSGFDSPDKILMRIEEDEGWFD